MIAIIPAKGYSKRISNKNLRLINNKPLIYYSIKSALKSKLIKRVIVSTDSVKIANLSIKYGAEVPFIRPKKLSKNSTLTMDVCSHAVKFLEKKDNFKIKEIIILQPTSPLRNHNDIDKAIRLFRKSKKKYLTSFTKVKPINWYFYKNHSNGFKKILPNNLFTFKKFNKTYVLNGSIYIIRRDIIFRKKMNLRNILGVEIPFERSIDIDDINDLKIARKLIKKSDIVV